MMKQDRYFTAAAIAMMKEDLELTYYTALLAQKQDMEVRIQRAEIDRLKEFFKTGSYTSGAIEMAPQSEFSKMHDKLLAQYRDVDEFISIGLGKFEADAQRHDHSNRKEIKLIDVEQRKQVQEDDARLAQLRARFSLSL